MTTRKGSGAAAQQARRRSKYGNKGTMVDGIPFSSKKEAARYQELKRLQQAGIVRDFEMQPKFILQEAFRKNGKLIRAIYYVADFRVTYTDGHQEIEDVKGRYMTEVFKLKWKLWDKRFPGVTWHNSTKKWQAQIEIKGRKRYLGLFEIESEAYHAYTEACNHLGWIGAA